MKVQRLAALAYLASVRLPFGLDCPTCHLVTVDKMIVPSFEVVMRWLTQGQIPHYLCEQCHGIHIVDIQSLEGVLESRLFVESEGLMFTTELEIRPVFEEEDFGAEFTPGLREHERRLREQIAARG